jgi:hypothetical protein
LREQSILIILLDNNLRLISIEKFFLDKRLRHFGLKENSEIYFDLESRYDDLVRLYGHEVVGDAIETVVIKNENSLDVDIEDLSSQVLKLLRKRIEPEETLEDSDNVIQDADTEQKNAMIQIQADVDKLKNVMGVKESKIYYNVLATSESDLRRKFGLRKDRNGWYLKESAEPGLKFDAMRAFGIL